MNQPALKLEEQLCEHLEVIEHDNMTLPLCKGTNCEYSRQEIRILFNAAGYGVAFQPTLCGRYE